MADGCITLVGSGAVIVSAGSIDAALAQLLTEAVSVDDCLGAIVAALSAHVRTLPSLVCAIQESDGIRVLLRGTAEALVTTAEGEQRLAPGSVSTWAEHMIPTAASLVLRHAPDGSPVILPGAFATQTRQPQTGTTTPRSPAAPIGPAPSAAPPAAAPTPPVTPAITPADDPLALASSTLAWLGDAGGAVEAVGAGAAGQTSAPATDEAASEPLPPSADAPDEALEGVADPAPSEPDPAPVASGAGDVDDPFGFRHLLDETMHVSTEEAAVRPLPEDEEEPEAAPAPPAPVVAPAEPEPVAEPSVPLPVMTGGGLIDSVPGSPVGAGAPVAPGPASVPTPVPPAGHGQTASQPASPARPAGPGAPFASTAARPPIQAVLCDLGHPNPVISSECRICRHPLLDRTPRSVPRPSLGRLAFTDGMVAELDSPVLIGRAPAESMAAPDLRESPKLLSLPSQDKRISRLHAEIRLEGWQVYVLDSSSLNGTTVIQPGLPPRQLRSGEPCLIEPGTSVNLGGAVTFTFEGPSSR